MTPDLPAVIAELKRLKHACQVRDKWLHEDSREEYTDALIEHDTTLIAAAEECADWERWAKEVLTDFRIPFDEHKVGIRLAFTQWMADQRKAAEECERLRGALDKIRQAEPCTHEGSCFYPRHDGDGNFISDDHVDPLSVIQDMVGIARAALEGKT